jgi:hypothetical protein
VGWFAILGGLFRMFAPEGHQGGQNTPTFAVIMVIFAIGMFLTFKAYSREDHGESDLNAAQGVVKVLDFGYAAVAQSAGAREGNPVICRHSPSPPPAPG